MAEITVTKENFIEKVLQADKPVLVDFWASWCGPCKMLSPILSEIAEEYADSLLVGKINVDEETELAEQFRVESIPMLVMFKDGKVINGMIGYSPKEQIVELFGL